MRLDFLRGEGSLYRELQNLGGRGVGGLVEKCSAQE